MFSHKYTKLEAKSNTCVWNNKGDGSLFIIVAVIIIAGLFLTGGIFNYKYSNQDTPGAFIPLSPTPDNSQNTMQFHTFKFLYLTPTPTPTPQGTFSPLNGKALVFNGVGTSPSDTQNLVQIMNTHGLQSDIVTSDQLNTMTLADITKYHIIIWPGGDSSQMSDSLTPNTREIIHEAVENKGVNYAGFCAGAWIIVGQNPPPGGTPTWGLALVPGTTINAYTPPGIPFPSLATAAMVYISFPNGSKRDIVWWDGPVVPSLPHGVVGKYPDGEAAMIETFAGKGYLVVSGVHPEAPQSWRDVKGLNDLDGLDYDVAWNIIQAAYTQTPLPVF